MEMYDPCKMRATRRRFLTGSVVSALFPLCVNGLDAEPAGESSVIPPSVIALKNRRQEAVPISSAERELRLARARELMGRHGFDAVCMAGSTSLRYFTGVHWFPSERPMLLVLPEKHQSFVVCPAFEESRLHEQLSLLPSLKDTRTLAWQEDEDPYQYLTAGLRDLALTGGTIGIEETMPYAYVQGIGQALPHAVLQNAAPVTSGCRSIKSPAEIELMQLANAITLQVYEAAWRAGAPGMTTHEFSGLIASAYERVGFPGEASCETGAYTALPHGSEAPQTIREDAMVMIDDGCVVEGYQSDITRSFVYGKPSDKMLRCFDIVRNAQGAALAAARPGAACGAVDAAARKIIVDAGFGPGYTYFLHRLGHGIGMDMHESPYLVAGNPQPLAPHMTFSDEPGIYIPGEFGLRLEDDMLIREDGAKLFTGPSPSLVQPFG
jgi:Xaa-Pro dipeptidase